MSLVCYKETEGCDGHKFCEECPHIKKVEKIDLNKITIDASSIHIDWDAINTVSDTIDTNLSDFTLTYSSDWTVDRGDRRYIFRPITFRNGE